MQPSWPDEIYRELKGAGVRTVGYVPDAGHKRLIELCQADSALRATRAERCTRGPCGRPTAVSTCRMSLDLAFNWRRTVSIRGGS